MPTPIDKGSIKRTPITVYLCFDSRVESDVLEDEKRVKFKTRPTIIYAVTSAIPKIPPYSK